MKSADIHAAGYAIPVYNINNDVCSWRINSDGRVVDLPRGLVQTHRINGFQFDVAKIADVLAAKEFKDAAAE